MSFRNAAVQTSAGGTFLRGHEPLGASDWILTGPLSLNLPLFRSAQTEDGRPGSFTTNAATLTNLPFNPLKDLRPVGIVAVGQIE